VVKIFNTLRGPDPLGAAFANLGKSLFGDTTANAINSEKLYAAQRENAEMDNLMARAAKSGVQNLGADPIAQAILLGSGYDPSKFGQVGLMGAATGFGAADPRTQNWQVGTGQSYDNTAGAFGQKLAETARSNNMESADRRYGVDQTQKTERDKFFYTPKEVLNPDGTPGFARQGELAGSTFSPILSETDQKGTLLGQNFDNLPALDPMQRQVLGANPAASDNPQQTFQQYYELAIQQGYPPERARNWAMSQAAKRGEGMSVTTPDGTTIQIGGSAPTNSVLSDEQGKELAFGDWKATRDQALAISRDPTAFGFTGDVRYIGQQAMSIAKNIGLLTGNDTLESAVARMYDEVQSPEARALLDRELNTGDPNLRALRSLRVMLAYQAAKANGSTGRDLSNQELQANMDMVGDPTSWLSSQAGFLTSLGSVDYNIRQRRNQRRSVMGLPVDDSLPSFDQFIRQFVAQASGGQAPAQPASQGAPQGQTSTGTKWRVVE